MKDVFEKMFYGVVTSLIFAIVATHAMDTPSLPDNRLQQLSVIKKAVLEKPVLHKKVFERSCDKIYGNKGQSSYFTFTPDGNHLIESRPSNLANFVVTNMQTRNSECYVVGDVIDQAIACNNSEILVGSTHSDDYRLLKIDLVQGKVTENFSPKVYETVPKVNVYRHIIFNPATFDFISVTSQGNRNFLCCKHDGATGKVMQSWENRVDDISYNSDGLFLVTTGTKNISLYCGKTITPKWEKLDVLNPDVIWHPKHPLLVVISQKNWKILDVVTGECNKLIMDFCNDQWKIHSHFFTPDGNTYIVVSEWASLSIKSIILYDGTTFEQLRSIQDQVIEKDAIAVSYDSKYLAYATKEQIVVYDIELDKEVAREICPRIFRIQWRPGTYQFIAASKADFSLDDYSIAFNDPKPAETFLCQVGDTALQKAIVELESADDWHIGLVADVCSGETEVHQIDQETYLELPQTVQILLSHFKQKD